MRNNVMHDNYKDLCAPIMTLAVGLNSWVVLHPVKDTISITAVPTIPRFKYFVKYALVRRVVSDEWDKLPWVANDISIPKSSY